MEKTNKLTRLTNNIARQETALDQPQRRYQLRITQYDKDIGKIKNLKKLFRKNKTSPLLKTPEKDFQTT